MKHKLRHIGKRLSPKHIASHQNARKLIESFGAEHGLVYFGHVSSNDEYHIVRGLTTSTSHRDLHYCVGTYQTYDVAFVERSDDLLHSDKTIKQKHHWHIMEFDLKTTAELPHVFVGPHEHNESFYLELFTKFPELRALHLGSLGPYDPRFLANHRVYGLAAQSIAIERLFPPDIAATITKHFGRLAIEVNHNSLYIYSEHLKVSHSLLESMLKNGLWLCQHIDTVAPHLYEAKQN